MGKCSWAKKDITSSRSGFPGKKSRKKRSRAWKEWVAPEEWLSRYLLLAQPPKEIRVQRQVIMHGMEATGTQ